MALIDPRQLNETGTSVVEKSTSSFTVGICATGISPRIAELLGTIETEVFPNGFSLARIVVVASACAESTLKHLRRMEKTDSRIVIIEERERKGKADAVNQIIGESIGEYLVFVNADALPDRGAISRLLRAIGNDPTAGVISGRPMVEDAGGVASKVVELMWETHNACSADLEEIRQANHATDELMAVRAGALSYLPPGVVNDGAYIAGVASQRGYLVRSMSGATVSVDTPTRPIEVIRQRRRILYGHMQVWRLVGEPPRTAESLVFLSPIVGFKILTRAIARRPHLLLALPFAGMSEVISLMGAIIDNVSSKQKHAVWRRYDD